MSDFDPTNLWSGMEELEQSLESIGPNPIKTRLVDPKHEYTIDELKINIQQVGSCLSSLQAIKGKIAGQCHGLKEGINTALDIKMVGYESSQNSVTGKRAEILSESPLLRDGRFKQVSHEACFELVQGWVRAYTVAWETFSRMITEQLGEAEHISGRLP